MATQLAGRITRDPWGRVQAWRIMRDGSTRILRPRPIQEKPPLKAA
jgi:hypothetical protein